MNGEFRMAKNEMMKSTLPLSFCILHSSFDIGLYPHPGPLPEMERE